ncbi:MAG TPA: hypothetical protein VJ975_07260, partial [Candidatus Limnocylindria bacterium]|nr:hypothetical protein [Candidatus Limnocylindria bacterium]
VEQGDADGASADGASADGASADGASADGASADGAELTPKEQEEMEHDEIRRAVIAAEREAVLALRDTGEIGEDVLHAVERDLDLDELRRET